MTIEEEIEQIDSCVSTLKSAKNKGIGYANGITDETCIVEHSETCLLNVGDLRKALLGTKRIINCLRESGVVCDNFNEEENNTIMSHHHTDQGRRMSYKAPRFDQTGQDRRIPYKAPKFSHIGRGRRYKAPKFTQITPKISKYTSNPNYMRDIDAKPDPI